MRRCWIVPPLLAALVALAACTVGPEVRVTPMGTGTPTGTPTVVGPGAANPAASATAYAIATAAAAAQTITTPASATATPASRAAGTPPPGYGDTPAPAATPLASAFARHQFPDYPGATLLGGQIVSAVGGGEIVWDGLTAAAPPEEVVAYFRARLGDAGFAAGPGGGGTWRLPPGDTPRHVLDIRPIASPGPLAQLHRPIPPGARTAIIVSTRSGPP